MEERKEKVNTSNEILITKSGFLHMHWEETKENGCVDVQLPFDVRGNLCLSSLTYTYFPCMLLLKFACMADFCIFQKFVNDWNETAIKRYHDVSVVTGSEQLQLKAVLFKNQDVKWLLRCETIDWECLLHNCDPLLLLIHKDTKSSEVLSPNGDILLKRTSFTSVCTQQLDANSVFSQHKCTKWVEKHTLDRWDIQRNDDGSFTPIRVYGQHAKALEIPTVKEVKKSIANKNNKKNKKNF